MTKPISGVAKPHRDFIWQNGLNVGNLVIRERCGKPVLPAALPRRVKLMSEFSAPLWRICRRNGASLLLVCRAFPVLPRKGAKFP
ncbi:hypothetical protein [Paracoccus sp. (in: a-proteobacteria)]|uniref:hypothetical protein n=1 Tax=Paracoccus sp. TaxID=267 RepID=UPI0035B18F15